MPRVSRQGVRRNRISRIIDFAYGNLTRELDESEHFEVKAFRSNHGGTWTAYLTGVCESGEAHVIMVGWTESTENRALSSLLRACRRHVGWTWR
ncbi:hypothetical protein SLS56_010902 [Neofusicoccum ribis]|uniref:Uncharacterized protein n=1 Tax=Neofusicoccum ribis TaxID=45134 RepID=A0ABR3SDX7_9PEZI